jgi:hypothetical protein
LDFVTQALQHSKVKLTWDEDDADRVKVTRRKFDKDTLDEMDFRAYLASSSDDSEEEDVETLRARYKSLLRDAEAEAEAEKAPEGEMEITFTPGLSEAAAELLAKKQEREASNVVKMFVEVFNFYDRLPRRRQQLKSICVRNVRNVWRASKHVKRPSLVVMIQRMVSHMLIACKHDTNSLPVL